MNINMDNQVSSNKVLSAISALKEKAAEKDNSGEKEVDLLSIVKKLSRNRERSSRSNK